MTPEQKRARLAMLEMLPTSKLNELCKLIGVHEPSFTGRDLDIRRVWIINGWTKQVSDKVSEAIIERLWKLKKKAF